MAGRTFVETEHRTRFEINMLQARKALAFPVFDRAALSGCGRAVQGEGLD